MRLLGLLLWHLLCLLLGWVGGVVNAEDNGASHTGHSQVITYSHDPGLHTLPSAPLPSPALPSPPPVGTAPPLITLRLSAIVNKLGDPDRKLASNAGYLLAQLLLEHPAMKPVVVREVRRAACGVPCGARCCGVT